MNVPGKLAGFAAAVAVASGGAALAGAAIDPDREEPKVSHGEQATPMAEHEAKKADALRGLAVAEDGLRIVVDTPELERDTRETLRFRVVDRSGRTVRDFDVEHEKRMHLIVARRDLTGFQHLHPQQAADGSWSTDVRIPAAGSHRVFADFTHDGETTTLAADVRVDGDADLRPLPPVATSAQTEDGYEVHLTREGSELRFAIELDGQPVEAEPYLGANGHLVALREGDLAFLHVHAGEHGYETDFPTPGRYRLFLQFKHGNRLHTAAFTREVE